MVIQMANQTDFIKYCIYAIYKSRLKFFPNFKAIGGKKKVSIGKGAMANIKIGIG
jgi:hypothetical protein